MFTPLKDLPEGKNWTLTELNDREVQLLLPVIIFISFTMVVGIAGNALVLYIHVTAFKLEFSTHRYFITFLALADITFCMICDPFIIGVLTHPYTFTDEDACKSLRAFTYFNILVSILVLSVIAIDRYKRICRPYGNQFSKRGIITIFGIIVFISFIFSIPCFILYGRNTVETGVANITGIQCFPDDMYKDTLFPYTYVIFLYAVFIILTATISVFYMLVWRQIRKHKHSLKAQAFFPAIKRNTSSCTGETNGVELVSGPTKLFQNIIFDDVTKVDDPEKCTTECNKTNKPKKQAESTKHIRVSKMLFAVTAFFVLSFAPFLSLELLTLFDERLIEDLDNTSTVFYQLFWRTFAIHFMVNPFIYGVMDRRFRMECKKLVYK
ncbi:hypothetical protein CHS0354_014252 [Potamilus streckersoni]|uniref:G-protein coupled receptors family 1 profile domain-containing protein n=1 Tax=Potamilus streckersoni TaxID=2493646 RepID=A0AAE0T1H7_9BIVA|nr:hypothetical protein CHS0354_014252 [Potamilus streckersoni]